MSGTFFVIVEGAGEEAAVPILLRRIGLELLDGTYINCLQPYRIPRTRISRQEHLSKAVGTGLARLAGNGGGSLLILFDSDDDLPCAIGPTVKDLALASNVDVPLIVVAAVREFESWFLASAESLQGYRRVRRDAMSPPNPESIRGAKEFFANSLMEDGATYSPTVDQPAFTSQFDLQQAMAKCASLRKLVRDVSRVLRPDG